MKLLNKLLPIASIGAIAGITAPIICSCANNNSMEDLSKYEAKIASLTEKPADIQKAYFEASNFKDILTDDFKVFARAYAEYWAEEEIASINEETTKLDYVKGYMQNISIEKKTVSNANYYLVSADFAMEYSITTTSTVEEGTQTGVAVETIKTTVSGIPYMVPSEKSEQYGYVITPDVHNCDIGKWSDLNANWSVKQYVSSNAHYKAVATDNTVIYEATYSDVDVDDTYNKDNLPESTETSSYFIQYSTIQNSHYLKNI